MAYTRAFNGKLETDVEGAELTPQYKICDLLAKTGIAYKEIEVYGSQIVITSWSEDAARKWARLLLQFAKLHGKGVVKTRDTNKEQKGTRLLETHIVWRTFGYIA